MYAPDGELGQRFGASVAIAGDNYAVVGSPRDDETGVDSGSAYLFHYNGSNWTLVTKLVGSDTAAGDRFGASVAIQYSSGGAGVVGGGSSFVSVLVGAPQHATGGVVSSGAAYGFAYYPLSGSVTETKVAPLTPAAQARFGASVALHPFASLAVYGAPGDTQAGTDSGAIYIQVSAAPLLKRMATDAAADQLFGSSVAAHGGGVTGGGLRIVAGAPRHDGGGTDAGAAYVLSYDNGQWSETARFDGNIAHGHLGAAVDISWSSGSVYRILACAPGASRAHFSTSSDGTTWAPLIEQPNLGQAGNSFGVSGALSDEHAVVGAPRTDFVFGGVGRTYFFDTDNVPVTNYVVANPENEGTYDALGTSLDADTGFLVSGAPYDDDIGQNSGSAYVWEAAPNDNWSPCVKIDAGADAHANAHFGTSVAVHGDLIAVGASGESAAASNGGAVYVFRRSGTDWNREFRSPYAQPFAFLGSSVELTDDRLVSGAPQHGNGMVLSFDYVGGNWVTGPTAAAPGGGSADLFGHDVAVEGTTLVVGSPHHDHLGIPNSGAAYVFERQGNAWVFQQKLVSVNLATQQNFGHAVDIAGEWIVIGAPHSSPATGTAYTFRYDGSSWNFQASVHPFLGTMGAQFGNAVATDGVNLAVGSWLEDDPTRTNTGTVTHYRWSGINWAREATLTPLNPNDFGNHGAAVSVAGNRVVGGAPGWNSFLHDGAGSLTNHKRPDRPRVYCVGKTNSIGCVPFMSYSGTPSMTSSTPFLLSGWNLKAGEPGFLIYGFAKQNLGFHGGKLCVKLPFRRWLPPKVAPPFGPPPCDGMLDRNFNNRIQNGTDPLLTPGQRVFAQWYMRDQNDPAGFGDGFTDAVRFTVCP